MSTPTIGPDPFTPRSGQEPKVFLGRERELVTFKKHLDGARRKRYDHFVVVGGWGIGKTTLLKEFRKEAHGQRVLTAFVSVHEFRNDDLQAPVTHLLTHIPRNLPIRFERLKRFAEYLQGVGITLPVIGGGFEIGQKTKFDGDPQALLLQGLFELWHDLKEETDALVVFVDDAQNYSAVAQFLSVLKNVLSDDDIAKKTGYLYVLAATEEGWSQFLKKYHPIGRYFVPALKITSFSQEQTVRILEESLKGSGVAFSREVKDAVYEYTEGHPYQLQILSSYLFENQIKGKVDREQLDVAIAQTLDELGSIILDPLYTTASEQERATLQLMASEYRVYSFDEILKQIYRQKLRISKGTLATAVARLSEKGLLVKTERGKYRLVNRLFNEFVARQ
jgi:hypothetical protein